MSLNPTLTKDINAGNELVPQPYPNETFIAKKKGVSFSLKNSQKKYKGIGVAFLTDRRVVLLRTEKVPAHRNFSSIELPLALVRDKKNSAKGSPPKFHQPLFGANYLSGIVDPVWSAPNPIESTAEWIIEFPKGECQPFVSSFFNIYLQACLINPEGVNPYGCHGSVIWNPAESDKAGDPTDPTLLYMTEPMPVLSEPSAQLPQPPPQYFYVPQSPQGPAYNNMVPQSYGYLHQPGPPAQYFYVPQSPQGPAYNNGMAPQPYGYPLQPVPGGPSGAQTGHNVCQQQGV